MLKITRIHKLGRIICHTEKPMQSRPSIKIYPGNQAEFFLYWASGRKKKGKKSNKDT